jgi:predicted PurR-regulated permease PerM
VEKATEMLGYTEEELDRAIINSMSGLGKDFVISITAGIGNIVSGIVDFFFMTFAMFFLLRDGPQVLSRAHEYVPFPEEEVRKLDLRIRDIIVSTIYGGVAVGVIQGIIAGVTFYFLDIPSAALWGFATAVASFIPLLGAFTVWGPVMVYLFIKGFMAKGFILAFIGLFGISMIDNVLKPIIIGGRTKMPILVIFFSVLGGIQLFGLIGLIMGPLVLAIFVSVIEIFRRVEGGINT